MSHPPIAERVAAVTALRASWDTLLREVEVFVDAAPEGSASRLGRLEVFKFLWAWPNRVDAQATRERERAASNGHAPSGGAVMKR